MEDFNASSNSIHSYFSSRLAAAAAGSPNGPLSIFRHVGHVVLPAFQQRDNLSSEQCWYPHVVVDCKDMFRMVNMAEPLKKCWTLDRNDLVDALVSLSSIQTPVPPFNWRTPFIVALADADHLERACNKELYDDDFDLPVQIYVSRLLFELIACPDILTLFSHLIPSSPVAPLPTMPKVPASFSRSPGTTVHPSPDDSDLDDSDFYSSPLTTILRNAESTGYRSLTPDQEQKVTDALTVPLYPYQKQTVRWMLDKENDPHTLNDYFWQEYRFTDSPNAPGGSFFYFPLRGELRICRPPSTRGGMVTEEMGLGKTVEALAVIAAQRPSASEYKPEKLDMSFSRKPLGVNMPDDKIVSLSRLQTPNHEQYTARTDDSNNELRHGDVVHRTGTGWSNLRVTRWPSRTTLVVCPQSLLAQWKSEAQRRAPNLSLRVWKLSRNRQSAMPLSVAIGQHSVDIVLATYDMVRSDALLSKIHWRRVILDEAQVTRRSATQVARDVFNLRCDSCFLMTGTPLVSSINDIRGQLATLKVWPFTLEQDGFWEAHVSLTRHGLGLIKSLLDVTMMRHSKAQGLSVELPPRTHEVVHVRLQDSFRATYLFLLAACIEDVEIQAEKRSTGPYPNRTRRAVAALRNNTFETQRVRVLFRQLIMACLSPRLIECSVLDVIRRQTLSLKWGRENSVESGDGKLELMSPQDAILYIAESSTGIVRDSNRNVSAVGSSSVACSGGPDNSAKYSEYMGMSASTLRELVVQGQILSEERAMRASRARLAGLLTGGVHRLNTDTLDELRRTAVEVGIATEEEASMWPRQRAILRLRTYYDWASSTAPEVGTDMAGLEKVVHGSGFTAIMKLIEKKENPTCPICLTECDDRLAVTKCGHLYCLTCMMTMLRVTWGAQRCPICRRELVKGLRRPVEIFRNSSCAPSRLSGGQKEENAGNSSESSECDDGKNLKDLPDSKDLFHQMELLKVPSAQSRVGLNPLFPTLPRKFLQHMTAVRSADGSPKLESLLKLILDSDEGVKFCVVAGSTRSLSVIAEFLEGVGIGCVGAGSNRGRPASNQSQEAEDDDKNATSLFDLDDSVRVFLLNPSTSAGLTLTRASVVVFMEVLVREADELQAAARVHRIGQTRPVRIVRVIVAGSVEEEVAAMRGRNTPGGLLACAPVGVGQGEVSDRLLTRLFGSVYNRQINRNS